MSNTGHARSAQSTTERIPSGDVTLEGKLIIPEVAIGIVLFAHGSGSSRHSPRNQFVAQIIGEAGAGTLLLDLLTKEEEALDMITRHLRFDIELLARRLVDATDWLRRQSNTSHLKPGYFGSSTGGAAALVAAATLGEEVRAVVSRGGRPDLAGDALTNVKAPTLLIVGGLNHAVIELNRKAYEQLRCAKELKLVPGASHLFEEPGALEELARLAAEWFQKFLGADEPV
jgi:putative phosphoribosyl transferase